MQSIEETSSSSSINSGKKKRRSKKDLSMMELIEQVKSHKSRTSDNVSESRQLPKQRSYPSTSNEDYWMKQYSDSDDDSDGAFSEPVQVQRPARPSTARGRRRVSVDLSGPSSTGSEHGSTISGTDSPRFEEVLETPNRSSQRSQKTRHNSDDPPHNSDDPPRSKSRMSNQRPLKYKKDKDSSDVTIATTAAPKGRSRNLPPLSRELSSLDPSLRQSPLQTRLGRETSVLSSIQTKSRDGPRRSSEGHSTGGGPYTLERQRTMILEK